METLVALGSTSAFALFLFFLVRYTFEMLTNELTEKMMAMMVLNDALTSSTLIILIVNVGKFLERKIKKKIENMTE
jgi:cation transport ATPase